MGNFSISHYTAIRLAPTRVELLYLLDMAEIPTFQELQESKLAPDAKHPSAHDYLTKKAEALKRNLHLQINGKNLALRGNPKEIIFPPGAGNLPTLKLMVVYHADLDQNPSSSYQLYFEDRNYPDRAGWKEIIIQPSSGVSLITTSAPERDRSAELSDYPTDLLNSPPQDLKAYASFMNLAVEPPLVSTRMERTKNPGEQPQVARLDVTRKQENNPITAPLNQGQIPNPPRINTDSRPAAEVNPVWLQANRQATPRNSFTELMATKHLGLGIIFIALSIAVGLGAFHALEPGHGKTLVAAYLVGSRGTMKHALLLGLIVTAAHTAGVYLLGAVTLFASRYIVPDQLYPWLGVASGTVIAGLGLILLLRRYLGKPGLISPHDHPHTHAHDSHHHHHHHGRTHHHHDHDHQVSLRELVTLGVSGGIVPCPAALVVLLSAVSLQRIGFGLLLIVAFSVGLAAVLIAIGLLMVYARQFMSKFKTDSTVVTYWLPLTSAAFILLFGLALTIQSLQSTGIIPTSL